MSQFFLLPRPNAADHFILLMGQPLTDRPDHPPFDSITTALLYHKHGVIDPVLLPP